MLENIDCSKTLSKDAYRERMPGLQARLFDLQRRCWHTDLGVVVVVEGWSASNKGAVIKKLTERLEPRAFEIYSVREPRTYLKPLPWLYRFWLRIPSYGRMAIFHQSWHQRMELGHAGGSSSDDARRRRFEDINGFERALTDDRYAVVKFFMHLSREQQAERLKKLDADESTSWRVTERDWEQNRSYDEHRAAADEVLARTETEWAPWTIVEAHDVRWARVKIFESLINHLDLELAELDA